MWEDLIKKFADPERLFELLDPLLRVRENNFLFLCKFLSSRFLYNKIPKFRYIWKPNKKRNQRGTSKQELAPKSAVHAEDKSDKMNNRMEATYNCEPNDCSFVIIES